MSLHRAGEKMKDQVRVAGREESLNSVTVLPSSQTIVETKFVLKITKKMEAGDRCAPHWR